MSTPTTDTASDSGDGKPVIGTDTAPVSLAEHSRAWATAAQKWVQPPDLWHTERPSLKASWVWAMHGEHLPDVDTARLGSRIGAAITIPARAVLLYLDWLAERPSRLVAAALLVTVTALAIWS